MSSNAIFETASAAALGIYMCCVGLWVWSPNVSKWPILIVNLATAGLLAAYALLPPHHVFEDVRLMAIVGFEGAAFFAALMALVGNRAALYVSYAVFVIHLFASIAAVCFAVFVRFNGLT